MLKDEGIVMPSFAALRTAVFPLSTKNLRGADVSPPSVRGLRRDKRYTYFRNDVLFLVCENGDVLNMLYEHIR